MSPVASRTSPTVPVAFVTLLAVVLVGVLVGPIRPRSAAAEEPIPPPRDDPSAAGPEAAEPAPPEPAPPEPDHVGRDFLPQDRSAEDAADVVVVPPAGPPRAPTRREHRPYASFGYGSLEYRETSFEIRPDLTSSFREPVYMGALGWEFLLERSAIRLGVDFFVTENGTEDWTETGTLLQTNDLRVWRLSLDAGYLYSSYDRGLPSSELTGTNKHFRFGAGLNLYYRHQHFQRDDFATFDPPTFDDQSVNEKFDMLGGEVVLELEVGPRDIVAAFARGKGGGGLVTVTNDALGSFENDARIWTAGVQGTIEAGVVSEAIRGIELRAGYRYHRLQVFEETTTVAGILIVNLPDNQTTIHMFFFEASFPF